MWTAALVPWRRIHRPPGCSFLLSPGVSIPVVDLSLPAPVAAATATAEAARSWGFFHLVSHHQALAVPEDYPAQALAAVGAFKELPAAERSAHYGHSMAGGIPYFSDVDLFRTSARLDPARIPAVGMLKQLLEWDAHATAEGCALLGLLSEGLRLGSTRLEAASCLEGRVMVCHYYLVCPEPKRTVGVVSHIDPGRLTLLAQDSLHKRACRDGSGSGKHRFGSEAASGKGRPRGEAQWMEPEGSGQHRWRLPPAGGN
ncbi:hypothetical protein SETIT_4G230500v2 [Setaria italica]|uniref:Non-haem dioxygenase N-terminal domain-containing protein n=1 Tax=Setaria italica TaxID=4555 RepID=A0A368QZ46_SETIT|nr:hypothetical protein SETIT_4G230500v2 [Setaria italica]